MYKKAILCVDDEKIILDSLKSQIKRKFKDTFMCEVASDAVEAFEVIDELCDDGINVLVIVSDWLMPGVKGDEFLVRVHKEHPNIVKLMLTGQADRRAIENAKNNANLYRCINKPWTEEELYSTLQSALEELKDEQ